MNTLAVTPWVDAVDSMHWSPGEHVTLIGPTGRGKTELLIKLMNERKWRVFINTKNRDSTQAAGLRGYRTTSDPLEIIPDIASAHRFAPRQRRGMSASELKNVQGELYRRLLVRLRDQGGWTVGLDEVRYITKTLGLSDELEVLWLQGRSEGLSLIANTQRPRHVPLEAYSQASHLFIWKTNDTNDADRLTDFVPNLPYDEIESRLAAQSKHDALYVNVNTGTVLTTNTREH